MTEEKLRELRNAIKVIANMPEPEFKKLFESVESNLTEPRTALSSFEMEKNEIPKEQKITNILHQIGIPTHIKGYQYLQIAISHVMDEPEYMNSYMTTRLYPKIAEKCDTTPWRVERAIRHAIERAWKRENDVLYSIFGNTIDPERGKASNKEFIVRIAEILK